MSIALQEIYIGKSKDAPDFYFGSREIDNVNIVNTVDMVGENLAIDTIEATVVYESADASLVDAVAYRTPLWYVKGLTSFKYYVSGIRKISKRHYTIKAVSLIGILDSQTYYGGFYDADSSMTFGKAVRSVFLTQGFPINEGLEKLTMYGLSSVRAIVASRPGAGGTILTLQNCKVRFVFRYCGLGDGSQNIDKSTDLGLMGSMQIYHGSPMAYSHGGFYAHLQSDPSEAGFDETIGIFFRQGDATGTYPNIQYRLVETEPVFVRKGELVTLEYDRAARTVTINGTSRTLSANLAAFGYSYLGAVLEEHTASSIGTILVPSRIVMDFYSLTVDEPTYHNFWEFLPACTDNEVKLYSVLQGSLTALATEPGARTPMPGENKTFPYPGFDSVDEADLELWNHVSLDEGLDNLPVYGWLPCGSKRDALHQLLFAYGVILKKNEDDDIAFSWAYATPPAVIDPQRIFDSGDIEQEPLARRVELHEHLFVPDSSEQTVLYDNTNGEDRTAVIIFPSAPVYQAFITSGSLKTIKRNANAAIVSGIGVLAGYVYRHDVNVKEAIIPENVTGTDVIVSDSTLVTVDNSENVLRRLTAYYGKRRIISNSIVMQDEACGGHYRFLDPFGDETDGYIQTMSITSGGITKADCKIITNYTPTGAGGNYSHAEILTGSGVWNVPAEVYAKESPSIRVVLIGGGSGGQSGLKGADGSDFAVGAQSPARGGASGDGGNGGLVFEITIDSPEAQYEYSCGDGGIGGAVCFDTVTPNDGSDGSPTIFGPHSSDAGARRQIGYLGFLDGKRYARKTPKQSLVDGGDGGYADGELIHSPGAVWDDTINAYRNGGYGGWLASAVLRYWGGTIEVPGGCGGGAAVGEAGKDGGKPRSNGSTVFYMGNGGDGANASIKARNGIQYGDGGYGGYGGGAGGAAGSVMSAGGATVIAGTPGVGGYGGPGGDGAPGCILIYY